MAGAGRRAAALLLCTLPLAGACAASAGDASMTRVSTSSTSSTTTTTLPPATTTTAPVRVVAQQRWSPFATVGGVTLLHPSSRVERIGFHQSSHEGARELVALEGAAAPITLESRDRLTPARTAADIVVDPAVEIRAPVSGVVKRGGGYTLYCEHHDEYAVIAPDGRPGWEVKVLNVTGLRVRKGDRVVAGETVLATAARQLPFESQVDELRTVDPAWPHVHVEVVDPAIPKIPSPGSGC
jgi:hypothetical protein